MLQTFHRTCPAEDKEVTLTVDYIESTPMEASCHIYTKGLIHSCSGDGFECSSCKLYNTLPETITR